MERNCNSIFHNKIKIIEEKRIRNARRRIIPLRLQSTWIALIHVAFVYSRASLLCFWIHLCAAAVPRIRVRVFFLSAEIDLHVVRVHACPLKKKASLKLMRNVFRHPLHYSTKLTSFFVSWIKTFILLVFSGDWKPFYPYINWLISELLNQFPKDGYSLSSFIKISQKLDQINHKTVDVC